MGTSKIRYSALFLAFLILIATVCLPVNAASATLRNIAVTKVIDEPYYKKTLFVITTDQMTYHIMVEANITTAGNETLIQLNATLYNPQNETIMALAQVPDSITLNDFPNYSGTVQAFHLHLDSSQLVIVEIVLLAVMVVALVLQVACILGNLLGTLEKAFFNNFIGPFIYASLPWVMLTLMQDINSGGFDVYVPYSPIDLLINLLSHGCYFIATTNYWWEILEHEFYTDVPIPFDGVWHIVWFTYYAAQVWGLRAESSPVQLQPTAEFVWEPNQPMVNETINFTSISFAQNGTIASYQWQMGDGNQETTQRFTYNYTQIGEYNVTLKVTDSNNLTGNVTHTVSVQPPVAAALRVIPDELSLEIQQGKNNNTQFFVGETLNQSDLLGVNFTAFDLSETFANQTISSGNVTFNRNDITVTKGTYTNVTATFNAPLSSPIGWYSGNMTATSANGGNATMFVEVFVYGPPTANFTWSPLTPSIGEAVTFDASSTMSGGGAITDYEWNFGDGQTASGLTALHTYTSATTYLVTLNVTDSNGLWNTTRQQVQVVQPHANPAAPVGGYSFQIQAPTKTEPLLLCIALMGALTVVFTKLKPKTKRKR